MPMLSDASDIFFVSKCSGRSDYFQLAYIQLIYFKKIYFLTCLQASILLSVTDR